MFATMIRQLWRSVPPARSMGCHFRQAGVVAFCAGW